MAANVALEHPLWEIIDNSVDETVVGIPGQRRLRPVPAPPQSDEQGLVDPLRLGRGIRLRLLAAVRALLADPSLDGLGDAARLSAVVLYAKSRAPQGRKDDNLSSTWGAELGRWLGMKESTVHHKVLPALRDADALHTKVITNAKGHPTGLDCLVMPLWRARKSGGAGHPLALSKAELATLLRLCEALFGHGWTPKDKEPTPPGLLAGRTGKGAATDRLGLLLMVLSTRASGWLQLCGGSVKTREGRGAATLARLLGCSPSGARKVLARLTEAGVVARQRRDTETRMNGRGRVMLLPVARAYGRNLAAVEAVQGPVAVFSARPDGAFGDHAPAGDPDALGTSGIGGAEVDMEREDQERPDGAELHADHASVVTPVVPLQLSCGFSGEGRGGEGRRPERACEGEDGPLRGEQPKKSPSISSRKPGRTPAAGTSVRGVDGAGQGRQQRGRVPLPPENLRVVLAPVDLVWARLEHPAARRLVEAATRSALAQVEGFAGRADAPQVLADRLTRRLEDQMRLHGPIKDPVGWLIGRGLPQRQLCAEPRCDEGTLLNSGQDCPRCEDRQADARAQRRTVAAAVDAAMPGARETERRAATEQQLHQAVTAASWAKARRWEQHRARQAAAAQARAEAAASQHPADVPAVPVARVVLPASRPAPVAAAPKPADVGVEQELVLEELTREQVLDWRTRGAADHRVVFDHIDRYGEASAQRLFTRAFVAQVQRLADLKHLDLGYTAWGQA
ncbi:hypothetical protein ACFT38_27950 [Streptomyces sp. NPDC056975]|uniref:hypothetical protein n=1 Tax=Streptomyces sp. NPDC056975 TaxID=3345985 RepID=UPI00362EB8BF